MNKASKLRQSSTLNSGWFEKMYGLSGCLDIFDTFFSLQNHACIGYVESLRSKSPFHGVSLLQGSQRSCRSISHSRKRSLPQCLSQMSSNQGLMSLQKSILYHEAALFDRQFSFLLKQNLHLFECPIQGRR